MLGTGIRVSECVGIDLNDIDFNNRSIKITRKGGNETTIFFGYEVEKALNDYRRERENNIKPNEQKAFFLSLKNQRLSTRAVQLIVKKYSSYATNKNISPHKLRSTFATCMYNNTHDIYLVAECLGHKSVNTTSKYYAKLEDKRKKAAIDEFIIKR